MVSLRTRRRIGPSFVDRSRNLGRLITEFGRGNAVEVRIVLRRGGEVGFAWRCVPEESKGGSKGWILAVAVLCHGKVVSFFRPAFQARECPTRVNKVLFSNRVRSRFWLVVLVTTYLLSESKSAAMKPLNAVFGESTRTCSQSNAPAVACRENVSPAWAMGVKPRARATKGNWYSILRI